MISNIPGTVRLTENPTHSHLLHLHLHLHLLFAFAEDQAQYLLLKWALGNGARNWNSMKR